MSPNLRRFILKFAGAMQIGLGILHLAVSPFIINFIKQNTIVGNVEWFLPPMLLNHVVVGILLLPLGILTDYAASHATVGEHWALFIVRTSAVSTVLLPLALFLLMGNRYSSAIPFVVATIIVSVASLILVIAAFWPNKSSAP